MEEETNANNTEIQNLHHKRSPNGKGIEYPLQLENESDSNLLELTSLQGNVLNNGLDTVDFVDSFWSRVSKKKFFLALFLISSGIGAVFVMGFTFTQIRPTNRIPVNSNVDSIETSNSIEMENTDKSDIIDTPKESEVGDEISEEVETVMVDLTDNPSPRFIASIAPSPVFSNSPTVALSSVPTEMGSVSMIPTYTSEVQLWDDLSNQWNIPQYHLASFNEDVSPIIAIASPELTNPEITPTVTSGDFFVEVAFKANSWDEESYKNPVFGQHGDLTGWEIRANENVELMWTTDSRRSDKKHHSVINTKMQVQLGEWVHVIGTYRWSQTKISIYVNGIRQDQYVFGNFIPELEYHATLARNMKWKSRYFDGTIAFANVRRTFPVEGRDLDEHVQKLAKRRLDILNSLE